MGLFSFLKSSAPTYSDKVWKTSDYAMKGMITDALLHWKQGDTVFVTAYFSEGFSRIIEFLSQHQVPYALLNSEEYDPAAISSTVFLIESSFFKLPSAAERIAKISARGQKFVLIFGHYPLPNKETLWLQKIQPLPNVKITFYSSLEDAAFKPFNGDRMIDMMEKMGMKEDEAIEHTMVTNAMERARKKIQEDVLVEQEASSEEEWFRKNLKKK